MCLKANSETIKNRYNAIGLIEVKNINPNGDPAAANAPRMYPDTGIGYITNMCLKSKVRRYVELVKEGELGFKIIVRPDKALNTKFSDAYDENGLEHGKKGKDANSVRVARDYMCKNYWDVRAFGSVMSTGDDSCGTVRGPVQFSFAESISPINPVEVTITRQARTTEERRETGDTEMGSMSIVPYGLYRVEINVDATLAQKVTGFTEDDLDLLWKAIINMFEYDRSAIRPQMRVRGLYVFKHDSVLGNCPADVLFDKIQVTEKDGVIVPRSFEDYNVTIDETMPAGVELIKMVG